MTKGTLLLFVFTASVAASYGQKIVVKKGQQVETTTMTKMNMEVMGQTVDNETTITTGIAVKDLNDSGYVFSNTIKHIVMKVNSMGQDMNFDSDKKTDMDGQLGQAFKDKINTEQEIQVNKTGKVISASQGEDKKAGPDMASMMGGSDLAKGQPYPILIQLPVGKTVKPGDTWTDSSGTTATIKTVTTYTLKSVGAEGALVSFTGTMAKSGTVEQNGMEIQMDMTGKIKGEATYETATGWVKKSNISTDLTGTLVVMGQNAPLTATITAETIAKKL